MVEEAVLLNVHQLRAGQPVALVVHHEEVLVRPPGNSVRSAQATGDVAHFTRLAIDLDGRPPVLGRLRLGRGTTLIDRHGQTQVEVVLVVDQAEGELVEVLAERPGGDLLALVVLAVPVRVSQLRQAVPFGDEDGVIDDRHAHRVEQFGRDQGGGDVLRAGGVLHTLEEVHLTGVRIVGPAPRADISRGDDDHVALGGEVERRDHRLKALRAQIDQLVVGVHVEERESVSSGVTVAHTVLDPRRSHPHHSRLGAQHLLRYRHELG